MLAHFLGNLQVEAELCLTLLTVLQFVDGSSGDTCSFVVNERYELYGIIVSNSLQIETDKKS